MILGDHTVDKGQGHPSDFMVVQNLPRSFREEKPNFGAGVA